MQRVSHRAVVDVLQSLAHLVLSDSSITTRRLLVPFILFLQMVKNSRTVSSFFCKAVLHLVEYIERMKMRRRHHLA